MWSTPGLDNCSITEDLCFVPEPQIKTILPSFLPQRKYDMRHKGFKSFVFVNVQLEQLQTELSTDRESLHGAENLSSDLMKEKASLEKILESLRENSERQVPAHT